MPARPGTEGGGDVSRRLFNLFPPLIHLQSIISDVEMLLSDNAGAELTVIATIICNYPTCADKKLSQMHSGKFRL